MQNLKVIAIDLAKHVMQVCVIDRRGRQTLSKSMSRRKLAEFLAQQPRALVATEACSGAHYWGRKAQGFGHQVMIIPPRVVQAYRQGHKTDDNDALAIGIAARQPNVKTVGVKTVDQQSVQSDKRVQEHLSDQLRDTGNSIRSLLGEFGFVIAKGTGALKREAPKVLAEADNGLPIAMRESLQLMWTLWRTLAGLAGESERIVSRRAQELAPCARLTSLEGVGSKNAVGLYVAIGRGEQFHNGRQAAACIGLTPKQASSGGKTVLKGIGKFQGNQRLRSSLIVGARAAVNRLLKREPRNARERWLKTLIERRGAGRAAVALANKNVRAAWSMLHFNTAYEPVPITTH